MNATITLTREAVEQAIKEYVEKQGYIVIKLVPPELNPMQILSDPGSVGVVVTPKTAPLRSQYE